MSGWLVIDEQRPVLWREYSFGPDMATTLVVGIGARKLLAVSPGWKLGDAAHDCQAASASSARRSSGA